MVAKPPVVAWMGQRRVLFRWLCWSCSACLCVFVVVVWLVFVGGLGGIATIGAALRRVVGVSWVYGRKTPRVVARKVQRRVPVEGSMVAKSPSACSKCSRPRWNAGDMGCLGCSGPRFGRGCVSVWCCGVCEGGAGGVSVGEAVADVWGGVVAGGVACLCWWLGGNCYHRRCLAACRRRVGGLWSQNPPRGCSEGPGPRARGGVYGCKTPECLLKVQSTSVKCG